MNAHTGMEEKMVSLAVVGATGAVGLEVASVLEKRNSNVDTVRFFASARSVAAKRRIPFRGESVLVEDVEAADFGEFSVAIFSIGSRATPHFAQIAKASGCVVVDNSSAFRMSAEVPLVIPEINESAIAGHVGIIANPNCTTAITLMGLYPLHRAFGVKRICATSYQAASGAGASGLAELQAQLVSHHGETRMGDGIWKQKTYSDVFPQPIALNVFPHAGTFLPSGSTDEEMKLVNEGRKIMDRPSFNATTTCVRVPVERVHSVDVLAQFERPVTIETAYDALRDMPGLDVFEPPSYPTPLMYAGTYNCAVGRLRLDAAFENSLRFWVVGDQLLKGAALNAVQIAEKLIE